MKAFLLWLIQDISFGELLAIAGLLNIVVSILLISACIIFFQLREWFETRPRRRK